MRPFIIKSMVALATLAASFAPTAMADDAHSRTTAAADRSAGIMTGDNDSRYLLHRSLLWNLGDDGSKFYRIPALATTNDGTIVAVADKRIEHNGDLPANIDVVCRTSKDNGRTWTPAITIAKHDEGGGYGDPLLISNRKNGEVLCIFTHGNGLAASTRDNHATVWMSRSADSGKTWTAPVNISDQFFTTDSLAGRGTKQRPMINGVTLFASSGGGLQLKDGRLMFVVVCRETNTPWGPFTGYPVYSDDNGRTWRTIATPADPNVDESKVVQLADGRVMMSIRNRAQKNRKFAFSSDRGLTWTKPEVNTTLNDPACNGDVIAYKAADGRNLLIHSIPDSPTDRVNVSLYASDDMGKTWHRLTTICREGSAYSALTLAPDGSLGVFTEESVAGPGFRLWYNAIDIDRLIKDRFPAKK